MKSFSLPPLKPYSLSFHYMHISGRRNVKSFTLPPRQAVATPEILVTSHFEGDKSHMPEDKADVGDDEAILTDDGFNKGFFFHDTFLNFIRNV